MYKKVNIEGITFLFYPFKDIETASLGVFIKAGSRFEDKKVKGVAHFLEHLLFKGSSGYSYRKIKEEIEGRGGSLNGFTSQELTAYYAHFLRKNLNITLDILLDMVFNPILKPSDIEKERKVILEEIKMYNDLPYARVGAMLDTLVWPNHSLGEEVLGYPETVEKINKKDLINFSKNYYVAEKMIIACCGDFSYEKIEKIVRQKVEKRKANRKYKAANFKVIKPKPATNIKIDIERKKLEQAHLCIGFRGLSHLSEERFALSLLNVVLGANMSSRLFEEIREKKALCYDISTELKKYKDTGAFEIHTGLAKENIDLALTSILSELKKIKLKDVSSCELSRAKDYYLGQIAMSLERPGGRMFYLAQDYAVRSKIYNLEEIKASIFKIDARQIRQVAKKVFNLSNICISCVGDIEEGKEAILRKIVKKRGV